MSDAQLPLGFGSGRVRPWVRSDRASLLRHADNPRVAQYLSTRFPHPYRTEDAEAWFSYLEAQSEPTEWAIEVDGEAVGGIGIRLGAADFSHSAELGYWLGEAYWRQGIISAAARAVVPFVMRRYGLIRLSAYAASGNAGSIRVLEKAGFSREGLLRARAMRDGRLQDHWLFSCIDEDAVRRS